MFRITFHLFLFIELDSVNYSPSLAQLQFPTFLLTEIVSRDYPYSFYYENPTYESSDEVGSVGLIGST